VPAGGGAGSAGAVSAAAGTVASGNGRVGTEMRTRRRCVTRAVEDALLERCPGFGRGDVVPVRGWKGAEPYARLDDPPAP
jgi:hypothetical protein